MSLAASRCRESQSTGQNRSSYEVWRGPSSNNMYRIWHTREEINPRMIHDRYWRRYVIKSCDQNWFLHNQRVTDFSACKTIIPADVWRDTNNYNRRLTL